MMDMACCRKSADGVTYSKPSKDEIYIIQQVVDCINDECFVRSTSLLLKLWERQWEYKCQQEPLLLDLNSPIYKFQFSAWIVGEKPAHLGYLTTAIYGWLKLSCIELGAKTIISN